MALVLTEIPTGADLRSDATIRTMEVRPQRPDQT